jgi:hypothetical protein
LIGKVQGIRRKVYMQKKTVKGFVLGFTTAVVLGGATLTAGAASGAFKDVKEGAWYENAVLWAQEKGIVNGYADGTFKPNNNVTRAELTGVVSNMAREGYINVDAPLEGIDEYEAIQIGKTTVEDLKPHDRGPLHGQYTKQVGDILIVVDEGSGGVITNKHYEIGAELSDQYTYPQVTKENLQKLEAGMSFEQVSLLFGGRGLLHSEGEKFKLYQWFGTDEPSPKLTFDKIDNGLSLSWSE